MYRWRQNIIKILIRVSPHQKSKKNTAAHSSFTNFQCKFILIIVARMKICNIKYMPLNKHLIWSIFNLHFGSRISQPQLTARRTNTALHCQTKLAIFVVKGNYPNIEYYTRYKKLKTFHVITDKSFSFWPSSWFTRVSIFSFSHSAYHRWLSISISQSFDLWSIMPFHVMSSHYMTLVIPREKSKKRRVKSEAILTFPHHHYTGELKVETVFQLVD